MIVGLAPWPSRSVVNMGQLAPWPARDVLNMGQLAPWPARRVVNMGMGGDILFDSGPENVLDDPYGQDAQTLHDKLERALLYISNWYKAVEGSPRQSSWWLKIDQLRAKVERALVAMDPALIYPGNTALAAYNVAALAFPGLWRELTLSADTFNHPGLLDEAADAFFAPVVKGAGAVAGAAGATLDAFTDAIKRGFGLAEDTASTIKWTTIGLGALAVGYIFYLTFETGRTARAIGPRAFR